MPSPFPGMDPYLEHPGLWPGVHQRLITYIADELNSRLPPGYIADIGERLYVVEPDRSIYPDAIILEQPLASAIRSEGRGGVMTASDPPWELSVTAPQIREVFVQILAGADYGQVVTAVEVLSPANKAPGSEGHRLYRTKQRELLHSEVSLLEIDLLRSGAHSVAAPLDELVHRGTWDYLVSLRRGSARGRFQVWPATVRERLPRIHVPLREPDSDLVLDLQALFERCYDHGPYAKRIDYGEPTRFPLRPADSEWVAALLREKGLRV